MNSIRRICVGLGAACFALTVAVGGCSGDTINNNNSGLASGDSGIDVLGALGTLGCAAGKKDCVSDTVARVCPSDGTSWIAVTCRVGEKCTDGDCKPVAGGATAACIPGDGACLPDGKAIRCRGDGSGYEQLDCPPATTCQNRGICMGTVAVGSSTCSNDRRSVNTFADGFHATVAACPANEYCVNLHTTAGGFPYNVAACKPSQCKPTAAGAFCGEQTVCGDPLNAAADQTKFVASCLETPSGFKWVGSMCPAGTTCNPIGQLCTANVATGGRVQAACSAAICTEGTQRCSTDGQGVQTCGADGKWGAATQCNYAAGERCFILPGTSNTVTPRAVCGDPICSFAGAGMCEAGTGKYRACDANGKLTPAATCAAGRCQTVSATGLATPYDYTGRCVAECLPGSSACFGSSASYRVCDQSSRYGAPIACVIPGGNSGSCGNYTDANGLAKHVCNAPGDCVPGARRCINADGGTGSEAVQICGADARWQPAQVCSIGSCNATQLACIAECIPGAAICDPLGTGQFLTCPADGRMPAVPTYNQTCPGSTTCKRAGTRSYGCVQCVGPTLADNTFASAESRCLFPDGDAGGSTLLQACKADNTWDAPTGCPGGASCVPSFQNTPNGDPGGVRTAYCP